MGACCEVAGNPAEMINPPLPVFGEQPGVLLQCQDDYLGGRGDPQEGKTPTDVVERKRSLPVVLAQQSWPEQVYLLLSSRSYPRATARLQSLVRRDGVHDLTRAAWRRFHTWS